MDISEDQKKRLFKALKEGHFRKTACAYAGIPYCKFVQWVKLGSQDVDAETSVGKFYQELQTVEALPVVTALGTINSVIEEGDWKAAAWFLERKQRKDWGKAPESSTNVFNQTKNNLLQIDLKQLSLEQLQELDRMSKTLEGAQPLRLPEGATSHSDPSASTTTVVIPGTRFQPKIPPPKSPPAPKVIDAEVVSDSAVSVDDPITESNESPND